MCSAARTQTNGSSQIASRAVAAHRDTFSVHMQAACMGSQPLESRLRVVIRSRKYMFRCESVIDRKNRAATGRSARPLTP